MATSTEGNGSTARCLFACPIHCQENVNILIFNAHLQAWLRLGALCLSSICVIGLLYAHVLYSFEHDGKLLPLPFPEITWAIVLAPWLGEGIAKLAGITKK